MSSPELERYKKRRFRKVEINGEEFTIRGMTGSEKRRIKALTDPELQEALTASFIMLNPDGSFILKPNDGESDEEFARRIVPDIDDIPPETRYDAAMASVKLTKTPPLENTVKN